MTKEAGSLDSPSSVSSANNVRKKIIDDTINISKGLNSVIPQLCEHCQILVNEQVVKRLG